MEVITGYSKAALAGAASQDLNRLFRRQAAANRLTTSPRDEEISS